MAASWGNIYKIHNLAKYMYAGKRFTQNDRTNISIINLHHTNASIKFRHGTQVMSCLFPTFVLGQSAWIMCGQWTLFVDADWLVGEIPSHNASPNMAAPIRQFLRKFALPKQHWFVPEGRGISSSTEAWNKKTFDTAELDILVCPLSKKSLRWAHTCISIVSCVHGVWCNMVKLT